MNTVWILPQIGTVNGVSERVLIGPVESVGHTP